MTKNKLLDSNQLKIIAIAAMTVDHIAWMLFPGYPREALPVIMHIIGRLTCPIMCYFIAEGYHYTKNIKKYTFRLFLFAFISHFAYIFASFPLHMKKSPEIRGFQGSVIENIPISTKNRSIIFCEAMRINCLCR